MDNLNIIKKAKEYFLDEKYQEAIFFYSQALFDKPDEKLFKLLIRLCDVGLEDSQTAQRMFDYFTALSYESDKDEAIQMTEELIDARDGETKNISKLLKDFSKTSVEKLEAISYEEFLQLVEDRGSFKIAFEDIMYSTKISLENKKQFYEFLEKLIKHNFHSLAYEYLDSHYNFFKYDKEVQKLYNMLNKKTHETAKSR